MSKQPPPAPITSAVGPCPTIIQISRTPRHWKFAQHHYTTRPPPVLIDSWASGKPSFNYSVYKCSVESVLYTYKNPINFQNTIYKNLFNLLNFVILFLFFLVKHLFFIVDICYYAVLFFCLQLFIKNIPAA